MAARKKRGHNFFSGVIRLFLTLLLIGILCACFCSMAFAYYVRSVINPSVEEDISQLATGIGLDLNSFIYVINPETEQEQLYETIKGVENRIWANSNEVPVNLKNAVVAIEDQRFYEHQGVDWKRTAGAVKNWMFGGTQYGGSTITQQLIKNATKDDDYSVKRKITEIFRAMALEETLHNKDQILEWYLNTIYLGRNCYGVKTAAATYFGKDIKDLDLAECAVIAGLTNNPSYYDPYIYPEHVKKRQKDILNKMCELGMIDQVTCDAAKDEELNYRSVELYNEDLTEPYTYFTDAVINDVINDLMEQKGYSQLVAQNLVNTGGLKIYATIDTRIQQIMDEEYANDENFPDMTRGEENSRPESAMVITDKSGNVKGIVGGRGTKTGKLTFSRATQARRQPGSSIKPLSIYGPAMDQGIIVPTSEVYDKPLRMENGEPWPRNDSGRVTGAPMVIKHAITWSVNTIAVQVLDMLTPQVSFDYLTQRLGFEVGPNALVATRTNADGTVQSDIDYAPLALGGATNGVTVREMAGGYSAFINDGVFAGTRTYTKVLDSNGNVLLENQPNNDLGFHNVRTAYFMLECMQGVTTSGTASNVGIPGVETAGKTGTTTSNRDRWFCGVTPEYAGAVWFGFDKEYTLTGLYGNNPASVMWNKIMNRIHEGDSGLVFDSHPQDFEIASYCMDTGLAPSGACRNAGRVASGKFWKGQEPQEMCKHQNVSTYNYGKTTGVDYSNVDPEPSYDDDDDYTPPAQTTPTTPTDTTTPPESSGGETGETGGNENNNPNGTPSGAIDPEIGDGGGDTSTTEPPPVTEPPTQEPNFVPEPEPEISSDPEPEPDIYVEPEAPSEPIEGDPEA